MYSPAQRDVAAFPPADQSLEQPLSHSRLLSISHRRSTVQSSSPPDTKFSLALIHQRPQGPQPTKFFPFRARRPARANRSGGTHAPEARWRPTTEWDQTTMWITRPKKRIRASRLTRRNTRHTNRPINTIIGPRSISTKPDRLAYAPMRQAVPVPVPSEALMAIQLTATPSCSSSSITPRLMPIMAC